MAAGLACAMTTAGCSVALVHGPPNPDEADYDAAGRYEGGVPCTASRAWPVVDALVLLATLVKVANYGPDQRDETRSGLMGAALGVDRTPADERLPRRAGFGRRASGRVLALVR